MEPDRRNRISELFHRAVERSPEERSAFLSSLRGRRGAATGSRSLLSYDTASARIPRAAGRLIADVIAGAAQGVTMINRQLGPYTIVAQLGSGGMGEVYRARDSKLGRDVAIKILPPQFTLHPERRARFAREARLLATLNHPHIAAIYGLEESGATTALVLELVEGPTLAERLELGPLPIPRH